MSKVKVRLDITASPPILVDKCRCDLCGACVGVCPPDVMVMTDHSLRIADGCIKCGLCIPVCPLMALGWNDGNASASYDTLGGDGNGR